MDKTENPFLATIRLPVKNSPILLFSVIVVHFMCLILPWMTGLALFFKIILMCVTVVSICVYLYRQNLYRSSERVKTLILDSDDNWQVLMNDGASQHAELGHSMFVHPYLTIISLYFEHHRKYFIFTPEILDADLFRRLRVRLRFKVGD